MARREQVMQRYVFLHADVATRGGGKVIELWGQIAEQLMEGYMNVETKE